jgi:protease-4
VVGTTSPAKHSAKIATGSSTAPASRTAIRSYRKGFDSSAKPATSASHSTKPRSAAAAVSRSAIRAPTRLPSPSPARKAPTTSAAETVSDPAKMPSIRCQAIWHSRAAKPEQKKATESRTMCGTPPGRCASHMVGTHPARCAATTGRSGWWPGGFPVASLKLASADRALAAWCDRGHMRPMSLDADLLIDRRRLKRRVSLWRGLAVLAAAGLLFALLSTRDDPTGMLPGGRHVARLPVSGFIAEDRKLEEALDRVGRDDRVRAVLVAIDSPGGSVAGGEALHAALARLAERKPVVAVMGGTAASAGYMVALPAARVFAREATVTGSIGVILQTFDTSELLARLGVRGEALTSGAFKDQPSPFRPLTEEGRAQLQRVVRDLHGQFVAKVAAGRNLPEERVRELADGRVFTGREAVELGLVDALGGEAEARAWLAQLRGVPTDLPVRDIEIRGLAERTFGAALSVAVRGLVAEWLVVDRVRAVWQPLFR